MAQLVDLALRDFDSERPAEPSGLAVVVSLIIVSSHSRRLGASCRSSSVATSKRTFLDEHRAEDFEIRPHPDQRTAASSTHRTAAMGPSRSQMGCSSTLSSSVDPGSVKSHRNLSRYRRFLRLILDTFSDLTGIGDDTAGRVVHAGPRREQHDKGHRDMVDSRLRHTNFQRAGLGIRTPGPWTLGTGRCRRPPLAPPAGAQPRSPERYPRSRPSRMAPK